MGVDTTTLTVNGVRRVFSMGSAFGQVPYSETLLETLRDRLGLTDLASLSRQTGLPLSELKRELNK